jgi:hypothetical protein
MCSVVNKNVVEKFLSLSIYLIIKIKHAKGSWQARAVSQDFSFNALQKRCIKETRVLYFVLYV